MTSKVKEVNVDELLNNLDEAPKQNKETKKQKQDDWAEEEDTNFVWGGDSSTGTSKAKTTKKKTQAKGWGEISEEPKPQQIAPPSDLTQTQEDPEKKKKIFKKFTGGDTKTTKNVVIDEYFPTLGETPIERPKPKPEPTPITSSPVTDNKSAGQGPRKFVNVKKQEKGEHFVPLDATLTEKIPEKTPEKTPEKIEKIEKSDKEEKPEEKKKEPEPIRRVPEGFFSRNTQTQDQSTKEKETAPPVDTKFKFGGEGPKKFSGGAKISFKREEEKNEQEELRLQKEREIEEKLAREREELAKELAKKKEQREQREAKKDGQDEQKPESTEGKAPIRFKSSKKEGESKNTVPRKISNEKPIAPVEKPEEKQPTHPVEKIEVLGTLSNKAWGDGAIIKKAVKK